MGSAPRHERGPGAVAQGQKKERLRVSGLPVPRGGGPGGARSARRLAGRRYRRLSGLVTHQVGQRTGNRPRKIRGRKKIIRVARKTLASKSRL